ncbi:uncharacterized protein V1510DRAFT_417401 [Dipodascopsis tothii]|uniref:uncharacterized protein n=1 Tax=Dipodascopsis tothii TaxID=44089 RepID=UPI0034CF5BF1
MVYELKGRTVLITGGTAGLGAELARQFAAAGCSLVLNHSSGSESSVGRAQALKAELEAAHADVSVHVIRADCSIVAENDRLVKETLELTGGKLDGVIANAGWTRFSDFNDLSAPTEEDFDMCYAVNVKSPWALLRTAGPTLKANPDGGFFLMTSSTAGSTASGSALPYGVSKAANLHLMRCMATSQAPKIRVNAVKPGLMLTEWGMKFGRERVDAMIQASKLQRETTVQSAAAVYIMLAMNESITGQAMQIDGGQFI